MILLKRLLALIISCISIASISGITVNAGDITGLNIDNNQCFYRLINNPRCPFDKIDSISINLDIENTSASSEASISFFGGVNKFIYKEFGTQDSNLENVSDQNGCVKITFDEPIFADNLPYTDIYISSINGDVSIDTIDFFGNDGQCYYYTIYGDNIKSTTTSPMMLTFIQQNIFKNNQFFNNEHSNGTIDFDISNSIIDNPFFSSASSSSTINSSYPISFDFYTAISNIKTTYTLFNNGYLKATPWKSALTIDTIKNNGTLDINTIMNNSFIYTVYAIDKTNSYTSDDDTAIVLTDGKYSMKVPSAETMSIADYLNAIYGSMTVDKILHSTFTDEQLSKMTKKELYQITTLISIQIEKTFGSIDTVMSELDKMVKTNINDELSVNSIYVSAFLPEDIKKIAELQFPVNDITQLSFIAQNSGISLIEAYCSTTKDNNRYISSIADGNIQYENYKYIDYATNNTPNSSTNDTQNPSTSNSSANSNKNPNNSTNKNDKSKNSDTALNNSNPSNNNIKNDSSNSKYSGGLPAENNSSNTSGNSSLTTNSIDINPSTGDRGLLAAILLTLASSATVIKTAIKRKH